MPSPQALKCFFQRPWRAAYASQALVPLARPEPALGTCVWLGAVARILEVVSNSHSRPEACPFCLLSLSPGLLLHPPPQQSRPCSHSHTCCMLAVPAAPQVVVLGRSLRDASAAPSLLAPGRPAATQPLSRSDQWCVPHCTRPSERPRTPTFHAMNAWEAGRLVEPSPEALEEGHRPHLTPRLVADGDHGGLQLLQGGHGQPHHGTQEVHGVEESREGLRREGTATLSPNPRCCKASAPLRVPWTHEKVPSHRGLEDAIEGASREGAG